MPRRVDGRAIGRGLEFGGGDQAPCAKGRTQVRHDLGPRCEPRESVVGEGFFQGRERGEARLCGVTRAVPGKERSVVALDARHLPERGPAFPGRGLELRQGAEFRQGVEFGRGQGYPFDQVGEMIEGLLVALGFEPMARGLAKTLGEAQAQAHSGWVAGFRSRLEGAFPARGHDVDGADFHPMTLGILDQCRRAVEPHGPGVEQPGEEGGGVVAFQVGGRVGDQRKGGRMGFGEAVERKGGDLLDDLILGGPGDPFAFHARPKPFLDRMHALGGALESHGASQLFGLTAAEARRRHGDAQQLFLEDRDAQGSLEDGFEAGMGVANGFPPGASVQVGVNHLAHDGPRANDGDLYDEIVETTGFQAGQGGHLRPAFDLEDPHRIRLAEHRVGVGIVRGQVGEVECAPLVALDQGQGFLQGGQHAEPEKVDLDDAEIRAVLLVPLHDASARHAGGLDGHDFVQAPGGDDDAPAVLAQVTGQALDPGYKLDQSGDAGRAGVDAGFFDARHQGLGVLLEIESAELSRQFVHGIRSQPHHLAHLPHRQARAVGDDIGRHGGPLVTVFFEYVLDDPLAWVAGRKVEVDIRPFTALLGEEALEEEFHAHRVHRGDAEGITDRTVGRGSSALAKDFLAAGKFGDVVDDQEVAVEVEFLDEGEFVFELGADPGWQGGTITPAGSPPGEGAKVPRLTFTRRQGVFGKAVVEVVQFEPTALGDGSRGGQPFRAVGEAPGDFFRGVQGPFPVGQ